MSDVYRALDTETGLDVAVKIVRSGEHLTALRLAREAQALERLDHPSLVRVLDSGTLGDEAYLVMEFVEGCTLAEHLHAGPMAPAEVQRLAAAVAAALDYVHTAGVVHRDVKPANVLLGDDGRIRLGDFGIASMTDADTLTLAGTTLGTVAYMAPEQLHNHRVGPPADIWSLGIVLLECLTGRRWYEGPPAQIIARRLRESVSIPDDLPALWQSLLGRMLAESPAQRISAADLGRLLTADTEPALPAWGAPAGEAPPATSVLPSGGTAVLPAVGTDLGPYDHTAVNPTSGPGGGGSRGARLRWLALAGGLALVAIVALVLLVGGSPKSSPARVGSSAPTTTAAQAASSALATLSSTIRTDEAAGTVAPAAGASVAGLASQAVTEAGAGRTDLASYDLQQAGGVVAAGPAQHTMSASAAGALQADLVVLAQRLGLAGAATVPTTAPPTTAAPPPAPAHNPPPPHHKGGGKGGGH